MTERDDLARLYEVAGGGETEVLDRLRDRAGLTWECGECFGGWTNAEDETECGNCGAPKPVRETTALVHESAAKLRKVTVFEPCEQHAGMYAAESRYRRAEVMAEGGWGSSPCTTGKCRMRPGTDFFNADFVTENPVYYVGT